MSIIFQQLRMIRKVDIIIQLEPKFLGKRTIKEQVLGSFNIRIAKTTSECDVTTSVHQLVISCHLVKH